MVIALIITAYFFCTQLCFAEQTFTLHDFTGLIEDNVQKPLPGIKVRLLPPNISSVTDSAGIFIFKKLSEGDYKIEVFSGNAETPKTSKIIRLPLENNSLTITLDTGIYKLDDVVAIAKKSKETEIKEKTSSSVSVITRSGFDKKAMSINEVLSYAPGTTVFSTGGKGDYADVSIRGSNSGQVQVLLDGMLLNDGYNGSVNLGNIPLNSVESVEVWRSGSPQNFQGNGIGGVININTRDIRKSKKYFSFGYGSYNEKDASALICLPFQNSKILLSADYSSTDNNFSFKSNNGTIYNSSDDYWTERKNDSFRSSNLVAKYKGALGKTIIDVSEIVYSNLKEIPGKDIVQDSNAQMGTFKNLFQVKISPASFAKGIISVSPTYYNIHTREHFKDLESRIGWGAQDNIYNTNTNRFGLPVSFKISNYVDFNANVIAENENFDPQYKLQSTIPLSCERNHVGINNKLSVHFLKSLSIETDLINEKYSSSYDGQSSPFVKTQSSKDNYLDSFNGGIKFSPFKYISLKTNYGDIKRIPTLYELFGDRGLTLSNSNLKNERSIKRDIGLSFSFVGGNDKNSINIDISQFSNIYLDLIQWYANDAGFLYADNVGRAIVKGTEISLESKIRGMFIVSGNWTFQKSEVTDEKRVIYIGKKLPNRPLDYGTLRTELLFKYFKPFLSLDSKGKYFLDRANQSDKKYPGRIIYSGGFSVPLAKFGTGVSFAVKNITDKHTFDSLGMPLPGRYYHISMDYNL